MELPVAAPPTDLFVTGRATRDSPDQTIRLRLPPNILHGLVQTLSEADAVRPAGQVQRLFDQASLTPVLVNHSETEGFVLKLSQKNVSQGKELPVEMFGLQEI